MQHVTRICQRCGQNYNPEWKSDCAAGLCKGVELRSQVWLDDVFYVNGLPWPYRRSQFTLSGGKTYIAPYASKPEPAPDPDHLMRLLTSLERRLLDAECGYVELEQGLSVQEEEARKLREQVNNQWVKIDKLAETPATGCDCGVMSKRDCDYYWMMHAAEEERDEARAFAQRCWGYVLPSAQRYWLDQGQVPDWIKSDVKATGDD